MNYYSRTVVDKPEKQSEVKFKSTDVEYIIVVSWEHCYSGARIKLIKSPLRIEASSFDGINYHSLEMDLTLNGDIISTKGISFKRVAEGFSINIPKENMKLRSKESVQNSEKN